MKNLQRVLMLALAAIMITACSKFGAERSDRGENGHGERC